MKKHKEKAEVSGGAGEDIRKNEKKDKKKDDATQAKKDKAKDSSGERVTLKKAASLLISIVLPIVVLFIVFNSTLSVSECASASMEPTIMTGDCVIAGKISYKIKSPERGDIVFITGHSDDGEVFLKRIIGMPGDHVEFKDGYVYINDLRCDERYLGDDVETNCRLTFDVPEDSYFVLGDNRDNSNDSRYWGNPYVSSSELRAKVIFYFSVK